MKRAFGRLHARVSLVEIGLPFSHPGDARPDAPGGSAGSYFRHRDAIPSLLQIVTHIAASNGVSEIRFSPTHVQTAKSLFRSTPTRRDSMRIDVPLLDAPCEIAIRQASLLHSIQNEANVGCCWHLEAQGELAKK